MAERNKKLDLVIYVREECHLCEEMTLALRKRQAQGIFNLQIIDIDKDPILQERFNDKIPVLMSLTDQIEICHYHLDSHALDAYLTKIR